MGCTASILKSEIARVDRRASVESPRSSGDMVLRAPRSVDVIDRMTVSCRGLGMARA